MRLSLMKAAHVGVGGAPCRKSGYVGRKRWAKPNNRFPASTDSFFFCPGTFRTIQELVFIPNSPEGTSESSPGRSPGLTHARRDQSRQGRLNLNTALRWSSCLFVAPAISVTPTKCHPDRSVPGFPATVPWRKPRVRPSVKKGRMRCTSATKFHRKSGVAQWRDLLFL
jgi:hypothetical protein